MSAWRTTPSPSAASILRRTVRGHHQWSDRIRHRCGQDFVHFHHVALQLRVILKKVETTKQERRECTEGIAPPADKGKLIGFCSLDGLPRVFLFSFRLGFRLPFRYGLSFCCSNFSKERLGCGWDWHLA